MAQATKTKATLLTLMYVLTGMRFLAFLPVVVKKPRLKQQNDLKAV